MSTRSVSQRTVFLVAMASVFLSIALEIALHQSLNPPLHRRLPVFVLVTLWLSLGLLVPAVLSFLGFRRRSRSVERLRAADPGKGGEGAVVPPVCIRHGKLLLLTVAAIWGGVGLFLLIISWPPPRGSFTNAGVVVGAVCLIVGPVLALVPAPRLCEINEAGIRAPEGSFQLTTFVPWEEITDCEIVHDDNGCWCDYFVLRDRSRRRRFRQSAAWLGHLWESDRARVFRALRSRFPLKEKSERACEPALTHQASSVVWDRELDG